KGSINLASYSTLTLSVETAKAGQWYGIAALTKDGRIAASIEPLAGSGGQTTSNAWQHYTLGLSNLARPTAIIGGIGLFAWSARSQETKPIVYLDQTKLLGTAAATPPQGLPTGSPSSTTAPGSAPTSTAAPASTPVPGQPTSTPTPVPASSTFDGQGI